MFKITLKFIEENFKRFNNEYFDGLLNTPTFEVSHAKSHLGQYSWHYDYNGVLVKSHIRISDYFNRSERDYQSTLIHEMIHLYIRQNKLKDTNAHHGKVFYSVADRINKQGGWTISRTDSIAGLGLSKTGKIFYVAIFNSPRNKEPFVFCIKKNYVYDYVKMFKRHTRYYKNAVIIKTDDDKRFGNWTECYCRVRGFYLPKSEVSEIMRNREVVYGEESSTKHLAA